MADYDYGNSEDYGSSANDGGSESWDLGTIITVIWYFGNALASILLLIFLTCFQHGMRCGDVNRRHRPRLVYPVNFLTNYDHRLAYLFSFIVMSGSVLKFFINGTPKPEGITDPVGKAFVSEILKYLSVCLIGLIFYPFPLCVSFDNIPMNVFGLLYTTNWLALTIVGLITRPFGTLEGDVEGAINIPVVISLIALEIYFIKRIVRMCRRFLTVDQSEKQFEDTHFYIRVRYLLLPAATLVRNNQVGTATKLFRRVYPSIPGFKYSTRIVCTVGLAVACLYQACAYYVAGLRPVVIHLIGNDWLPIVPETFQPSCIIAFIIAVINSIFTLRNYRISTRSLWIGDKSLTYNVQRKPPSVVVASLKFSGYTIAFLISGFVILQLILWGIFISLAVLFRYGHLPDLIKEYWVHLVMIIFVYVALRLFARCVFLQPNEDGALVLKNLHLFHIVTFFFLFLSVLLGVAGCILRILKAAVVGLVLIGRVDRCLFIRGFERFDRGYMAYRDYLNLEVSMTHPVLVSFCQLLSRSINERKYRPGDEAVNEMGDTAGLSPSDKSRIARNRWLVAYTLIRNPQLIYKTPLRSEKQSLTGAVGSDFKTNPVV